MCADIIYSRLLGIYIEIEYKTEYIFANKAAYKNTLHSIRFLKSGETPDIIKTHEATFELERYFKGELIDFLSDLDISHLSQFEQKVLEETQNIKYGRTITYSKLAEKINCGGARAVGNALSKNPIPIIIPCHRVVAKNGIGGYSGGIEIKTRLIEFEKNVNNL